MQRVPMADPAREYDELRTEIDEAVHGVLASGRYVLGDVVAGFERAVATRVGVREAVGVANGTDAVRLTLLALGIGEGDEVITTPFSFVSTATAILDTGATPVFADIDPVTLNLDPAAAAAAVSERTLALLPVHVFGQMADMVALERLAAQEGLALVEDAAQAFGASESAGGTMRSAGGVGVAGCFSFYPTKSLGGAGDGGMIVTDDVELATRLRRLRDHGRGGTAADLGSGTNSRLDALQAAILGVKLGRVDAWTSWRRAHAAAYDEALRSTTAAARPPGVREGVLHIYHHYTLRAANRGELRARFDAAGVDTSVFYDPPLSRLAALEGRCRVRGPLVEAERAAAEVLSVPVFSHLSDAEHRRVTGVLAG